MLTVSRVTMSFAGRVLFSDASLQVKANDRIVLIGANGGKKLTLFALIRGELNPGPRPQFLEESHKSNTRWEQLAARLSELGVE